jgi:hypothetical protein
MRAHRAAILTYVILSAVIWHPAPLKAQSDIPSTALQSILPGDMEAHVSLLSSQELEGRGTGQRGLKIAARYLATQLKHMNILPGGSDDSYYQPINLVRVGPLESPNFLEVEETGDRTIAHRYQQPLDYKPYNITANKRVTGEVVFAGFGISAPELDYDDYKKVDVRDKIVLVYTHTPEETINSSDFVKDGTAGKYGSITYKVRNAAEHGALGLLVVTDPNNFRPDRSTRRRHDLAPVGSAFPTPEAPDGIRPKYILPGHQPDMVVVHISHQIADALLADSKKTLAALQTSIEESRKPRSFNIKNRTVTVQTTYQGTQVQVQNVLGYIEGSNPRYRNAPVVITAHYDHDGQWGGKLFHGADDNASGTAAVLEIAEAFAMAEEPPQRSVWFLLFTGEEQGLLGSYYYTGAPRFPLEKTAAVLNLDMIGRNAANEVYVIGSDFRSSELHDMSAQAARDVQLTLNYSQNMVTHYRRLFFRSDQYPFARLGIPAVFYTSGMHADYHRPTDTADKINYQKMERIAKSVFTLAWRLADSTEQLKLDNDAGMEK